MVAKPLKGKYLKLEDVRVSYDEQTDTIHITSKDKDLPTGRGFHLALNKGKDAEYTLRTLLENEGLIPREKSKVIPEQLNFRNAINTDKWDQFPLGMLTNGEEAIWRSSMYPNLLIAGRTGGGKSVLIRNILFHCLKHAEKWEIHGIDLKRVELTPYLKYNSVVKSVATTEEAALELLTKAHKEMIARFSLLREDPEVMPPSWMIILDEIGTLLHPYPNTPEWEERTRLQELIREKLMEITERGGFTGIHIVAATQRVTEAILPQNLKYHFKTRIALGRMDQAPSQMLLGNNNATKLNNTIKGRGYFQQYGKGSDFQAYFSDPNWPYEAGIISK